MANENEAVMLAELGVGEGTYDRGIIIEIPEEYYLVILQNGNFLEPIFDAEVALDSEHIPGLEEDGDEVDCRLFLVRVDLGLEKFYFENVDVTFGEDFVVNVSFDMDDSFIGVYDHKKLLTHLMENMPTPEDGIWVSESNLYSTIQQSVQLYLNETLSEQLFIDDRSGELCLYEEDEKEAFEAYLTELSEVCHDIFQELGMHAEIHITNLETDPNFEQVFDADEEQEDDDEDLDIRMSFDEDDEEEEDDDFYDGIDDFDLSEDYIDDDDEDLDDDLIN